jgi:glucose/arabinose dehydrogenase
VTRTRLALFIGIPVAVLLGVFGACTVGNEATPKLPPATDGPSRKDDGAVVIPNFDAAQPTCTMNDIPEGTGGFFCDLPGNDAPLQVPEGFCIREFTSGVQPIIEARVLRFAPNGDLFVAAPSMTTPGGALDGPGAIVVLPDDDKDGRADSVLTFAGPSGRNGSTCATLEADPKNMACVHGLAFTDKYLYFTRSDEVRRFAYTAGNRTAPATSELVATLGGAGINDVRWTHTLEQPKDGSIYVSRGRMDTSACSTEEMKRGAVFALHVENNAALPITPELVADGFRNPMYLRCSPSSCGDCYASELTGDNWDGVGGKEKLALLANKGESWGYPCCVARDKPAPAAATLDCSNVGRELVSIPLHDTNFGLDFDRGGFPNEYKHGLFVALHGVITSFGGTGVVWVQTHPSSLRPISAPKMFLKGFGIGMGRATDVVFAPDGRMFVADDTGGKIYWVAPRGLRAPK